MSVCTRQSTTGVQAWEATTLAGLELVVHSIPYVGSLQPAISKSRETPRSTRVISWRRSEVGRSSAMRHNHPPWSVTRPTGRTVHRSQAVADPPSPGMARRRDLVLRIFVTSPNGRGPGGVPRHLASRRRVLRLRIPTPAQLEQHCHDCPPTPGTVCFPCGDATPLSTARIGNPAVQHSRSRLHIEAG